MIEERGSVGMKLNTSVFAIRSNAPPGSNWAAIMGDI